MFRKPVDNITQDDGSVSIPAETCTVYVDSNGIISASWVSYLETTGKTESNELLSFKELLEKANKNIAEYYTTYPTRYKKVEFNSMKLGYYLEKTDEEGTFKYVPAWILTQYEDMTDSTNETYPTQMVVLDATDGTVIDLMELSKALGTYQSYETDTIARDVSDDGSSSISTIDDDTNTSGDSTGSEGDSTEGDADTTGDTTEE